MAASQGMIGRDGTMDAGDGCLAAPLGGEDHLERYRLDTDGVRAELQEYAQAAASFS